MLVDGFDDVVDGRGVASDTHVACAASLVIDVRAVRLASDWVVRTDDHRSLVSPHKNEAVAIVGVDTSSHVSVYSVVVVDGIEVSGLEDCEEVPNTLAAAPERCEVVSVFVRLVLVMDPAVRVRVFGDEVIGVWLWVAFSVTHGVALDVSKRRRYF